MAAPIIGTLPPAPTRSDPANFNSVSETFVAALATLVTDVNGFGTYLGTNSTIIGAALNSTTMGLVTPAAAEFTAFKAVGLELANITAIFGVSGNAFSIRRGVQDQSLNLVGGNNANDGANIQLFGSTHATKAKDILFRSNALEILTWDNSLDLWTFKKEVVFDGVALASGVKPTGFASQAEAEAGTATNKPMDALRTKQALEFYVQKETQTFLTSGTWTKPADLSDDAWVRVTVCGGGGSGARQGFNTTHEGGGGAGYFELLFLASDLGATETVTVGSGGASQAGLPANGFTGGNSSFGSHIGAEGGERGRTSGGNGGSGGDAFVGANSVVNTLTSGLNGDFSSGGRATIFGGAGSARHVDGVFPGGGGGAGGNATDNGSASGAGADGFVTVTILG